MSIRYEKVVPELRIYEVKKISRERGRKRRDELESKGIIDPERTPTGRQQLVSTSVR